MYACFTVEKLGENKKRAWKTFSPLHVKFLVIFFFNILDQVFFLFLSFFPETFGIFAIPMKSNA